MKSTNVYDILRKLEDCFILDINESLIYWANESDGYEYIIFIG